jgi:intracellular septation protein
MVRRMMESALTMPATLWTRLNLAWVGFFVLSGIANLAVAYTYSENTWVNFKLFGLTGLSLVFIVGQLVLLRKYLPQEAPAPAADGLEEGAKPPGS